MASLFDSFRLGSLELPNRVVMAPLTRNRAHPDTAAPRDMHVTYYRQRASAGLIITEATQISPEGRGYIDTPGIHSPEQVEGWRKVTDAVHGAGGRIFLQLWHVGRISHVDLQPGGQAPVAPSAIRANASTFTKAGFVPVSEPRALETDEVARVVADYAAAARNAKEAGFDGVEIHAANGYLIDQFLRDGSNQRTDHYGGPVENRVRFLDEIAEAVTRVWEPARVGFRLSPFSDFGDIRDSDPAATFGYAIERMATRGLGYFHMVEGQMAADTGDRSAIAALKARWTGAYIANNGYDRARAIEAVESGAADLIAFGRPFISNPDLVERLRTDAPLTPPDQSTFYGGDEHGYTDYPTLEEQEARAA